MVSCETDDHSYLSKQVVDGTKTECVTEFECFSADPSYCTKFNFNNNMILKKDTENGECKKCTDLTDYADCTSCKKVGTDVVCYACGNGKYVKSNKKGCIDACSSESSFVF